MKDAPPRVLVVDDEKGLCDMLAYGLGGQGYEVVTVGSGPRALDKARETRFDLAVCDVMMPGMSGVEALRGLKELQPHIEVVMVTGYATLETAVEAMKRGAYDYIAKPYELETLFEILRKALERARLKAKVGELEQLNRLKSEFLANMSHELRTPLNAILGYTSLVLEEVYGEVPAGQRGQLDRVLVNSRNLLALINDILDLSRLNAGMMPTHVEEFDAAAVAREVVDTVGCLAQAKGLGLEALAPQAARVTSDKTKVKQILINLVGNAVKFTEAGKVAVSVEAREDRVAFRVSDTGPGIAPEDVGTIFEEFKQVDGAATRRHGGTGLGLSITRKLVDLLGGRVSVESEVGRGTTFIVELARALPPRDPLPEAAEPPLEEGKRRLLAIDDDPEVLRLLRDSLRGTGYAMTGATCAEEGLALARTLKPFVITLDIMMPHRDGWSVLQALKNDPQTREIPVIILSIMENRALGASLGVADYIVKPLERHVLLEKLAAIETASGKSVLVIDDDDGVRELVALGLEAEGYRVTGAASGQAALRELDTLRPDVVFLGLSLPDMSGFELLAELERRPPSRGARIFVLTARDLSLEETERLDKRVERIIAKSALSASAILEGLRTRLVAMAERP